MQFGLSNAHGGLVGPEILQVVVGHLGLAASHVKMLKGGRPATQQAHASAAPDTKADHDMHGGPAGCVHTFINTKVTVFRCVLLCTLWVMAKAHGGHRRRKRPSQVATSGRCYPLLHKPD
jgi:hypothetical protein